MNDMQTSGVKNSTTCDLQSDKLVLKLTVTLAADKNAIDTVVQSVMRVVKETKCADGREDAIELALNEALANAVIHGAGSDPSKMINQLMDEVKFLKNGSEIRMLKRK